MRSKREINIQIGERVRQAREQAKLTQEALAEKLEVSPPVCVGPGTGRGRGVHDDI